MIYTLFGQTLSGKTTLAKSLEKELGIKQIITYTDRPIRENEINGVDYHFVPMGELNDDQFFGHRLFYTAYREEPFVYAMKTDDLIANEDKVIVTDPMGVKAIKDIIGRQCVTVYLDTLESTIIKRSKERGDSIDEVERRLRVDRPIFQNAEIYSDVVISEDINGLDLMKKIIKKEVILWITIKGKYILKGPTYL